MWEFEAIGTHWQIRLPDADEETYEGLKSRISKRIEQFDRDYSRFRDDSLVHRMAGEPGIYTLPADAKKLFDLYRDLYDATDGAVTPLIGQMISDAGYDASYSFKSRELTISPAWDDVLEYAFPTLTLRTPALLDLGAVGKGYLVDIVADLIESAGISSYLIDAGGDIRVKSSEAVRIGLEHPGDSTQVLGVATLSHGAICGSSGNRRAWGAFHHILNPHTRESVREVLAVWVVAAEARVADGISTALFFTKPGDLHERLGRKYDFEYFILYPDYSFSRSKDFPSELFIEEVAL